MVECFEFEGELGSWRCSSFVLHLEVEVGVGVSE